MRCFTACAAVLVTMAFAAASVEAQQTQTQYQNPPQKKYSANRPRSRIVVAPRSFLDAGTEVLPGERKFTDYALPPAYFPMGVVTNTGGRVGWHQSPLPGPFDLPGPRNPFGW